MKFINKLIYPSVVNNVTGAVYYLVRKIGKGAYGEVWEGFTGRNLSVAIKIFTDKNPAVCFRAWDTEQEIHLRCLPHTHIVVSYDQFCTRDGRLILVMEKAESTLENMLKLWGAMSPLYVCSIGLQILDALDFLHNRGIHHRDVTLQNVFCFPKWTFKLSDFSISRIGIASTDFLQSFTAHPLFKPPEVLIHGRASHQSDLYQLGLILLSLLLGGCPVPRNLSPRQIDNFILSGKPREIAEAKSICNSDIYSIVAKLLRRRNKYRYASAREAFLELDFEYEVRLQLNSENESSA